MNKRLRLVYAVAAAALLLLAVRPVFMGIGRMLTETFPIGETRVQFMAETGVIPFAAVLIALIAGFLPYPFLRKYKRAIACGIALAVFFPMELLVEKILADASLSYAALLYRAPIEFLIARGIVDGSEFRYEIPQEVRLHFYLFASVLIVAATALLYKIVDVVAQKNKPNKRLVLQTALTLLYALVCVWGVKIGYMRQEFLQISASSAVSVTGCIMLAALCAGFACDLFLERSRLKKWIAPLSALGTALLAYAAQFVLLDGFYVLGEGFLFTQFGAIGLSIADCAVIAVPASLVFLYEKFYS